MKTRLYNFDTLKPPFYIVKLEFRGVYIIFLISAQNKDCGYSLEPPRRGRNMKNIRIFHLEIVPFLVVKFSIYLNRRAFVMYLAFQNREGLDHQQLDQEFYCQLI